MSLNNIADDIFHLNDGIVYLTGREYRDIN